MHGSLLRLDDPDRFIDSNGDIGCSTESDWHGKPSFGRFP
jgi:hypothetical protein